MIGFIVALIVVPALAHAVRVALLRRLGSARWALGVWGTVQVVHHRLWLQRGTNPPSLVALVTLLVVAALPLVIFSAAVPSAGVFAGLLVGGALSNVVESAARGAVVDYVCLRFWPSFNLADAAMTAGALGLLVAVWELAS